MESYVLAFFFRNAFHSWHLQQTCIQVKSRTRKDLAQQVDSSWEAADSFTRQIPALGFLQGWGGFQKELCFCLPCQHILRLLCLGPVPIWQIPLNGCWEVSVPFQVEVPSLGEFFPLSRATSTLINWNLSFFGPLGICALPPKRTVILAKKGDGSCLSVEFFGQVPPLNCRIVIWKEKETLRARLGCRLPSCVPRPEEMICRGSWEPESSPPESQNVGWRHAQK